MSEAAVAVATPSQTSAPAPSNTPAPAANNNATGGASLLNGSTAPAQSSAPASTPAPSPQPNGADNDNWRNKWATSLADDERKVWDNIAGRYTSEADMAKAHVSLVRSMDKRIPLPDENAKPEEWDQVYNKLGRPETPDKYQFEFPQDAPWDDSHKEHIKSLAPLFHKNGATQRQVNEFVKQQAELDKVAADAARAKAHETAQRYDREMQQLWRGEEYKRNQNLAGTTVKHYAGGDTEMLGGLQLADGTYVLDHPAMRRMLARIGSERAEDDRDPTAFNAGARASVKTQIETIEKEMIDKGITPTDSRYPHAKLDELYAKAYGKRNEFGRLPG